MFVCVIVIKKGIGHPIFGDATYGPESLLSAEEHKRKMVYSAYIRHTYTHTFIHIRVVVSALTGTTCISFDVDV